jgi:hypothetical protein
MSLPPCRRFHPAEVVEPHQSDFGCGKIIFGKFRNEF